MSFRALPHGAVNPTVATRRPRRELVPIDDAPPVETEPTTRRQPPRRTLSLALLGLIAVTAVAMTTSTNPREPLFAMNQAHPGSVAKVDLFGAWDDTFASTDAAELGDATDEPVTVPQFDVHRLILIADPTNGAAIPPEPAR